MDALAHQVNQTGNDITVELLGRRDDIPELLAAADALVLPSKSEGLPLVVMEAMASSTPVIATEVGGVPELLEHGVTAMLVPPEDEIILRATISDLLGVSRTPASVARQPARRPCTVSRPRLGPTSTSR